MTTALVGKIYFFIEVSPLLYMDYSASNTHRHDPNLSWSSLLTYKRGSEPFRKPPMSIVYSC